MNILFHFVPLCLPYGRSSAFTGLRPLCLCAFVPLCLITFVPFSISQAQSVTKYIYLDHIGNDYLNYLINSGQAVPDFIFQQPYDVAIWNKAEIDSKPYRYFNQYWQKFYDEQSTVSGQLQAADDVHYHDVFYNRYHVKGSVHLVTGLATFANRTVVDQDYKHDPDYAGDLSESENWLYGRVNDAYMDVHTAGFEFFIGRLNRNWGPPGLPSLILSGNPYSYDHFLFAYTYKKLKISVLAGRLENVPISYTILNEDTYITVNYPIDAYRYLVGHRLDLSFSSNFQVALTEMAVYGGRNMPFDWAYLNPMNFYYGLQRNDSKQMNGFWNLDIFYKPFPKISLYTQFMIDDIIVNNDPDVDDRARYPDRLALQVSLRAADYLLQQLDMGITYARIWNRTYQSQRSYENYHFRELGLGYPCAGSEEIKIDLNYWNLFPVYLKNETVIGRYGDVQLTDLFPGVKEPFPVPEVTQNIINTLEAHYFLSPRINFYSQVKYSANKKHYLNRIDNLQGWAFSLGMQLMLSAGIDF
jgi:hypothetical protein